MRHIIFLDGLRGMAILMVLMFHFLFMPLSEHLIHIPYLYNLGQFLMHGVTLFFVLSGFLIGGILLSNKNSKNYFKTFYIRRILRIIPLYYLLLALYYLLKYLMYPNSTSLILASKIPDWTYPFFLQSIFIPKYGLGPGMISASWSLCVEEQFYLVTPAIIYFLPLKKLPIIIASIILMSLLARSLFPGIDGLGELALITSRIDALLIGLTIALIYKSEYSMKLLSHNLREMKIMLAVLSFGLFLLFLNFSLGSFRLTWIALFFATILLIPLVDKTSLIIKLLQIKPLIFLGKYSYGIYLIHMPIHYLILESPINIIPLIGNQIFDTIIFNSLSIISSIIISVFIFEVFEKKLILFGKRFKY